MNQRQKEFLPVCVVVWVVTALMAGLLVWAQSLTYSNEFHFWAFVWVGSDFALIHVVVIAALCFLSLTALAKLTIDLRTKPTDAPK